MYDTHYTYTEPSSFCKYVGMYYSMFEKNNISMFVLWTFIYDHITYSGQLALQPTTQPLILYTLYKN